MTFLVWKYPLGIKRFYNTTACCYHGDRILFYHSRTNMVCPRCRDAMFYDFAIVLVSRWRDYVFIITNIFPHKQDIIMFYHRWVFPWRRDNMSHHSISVWSFLGVEITRFAYRRLVWNCLFYTKWRGEILLRSLLETSYILFPSRPTFNILSQTRVILSSIYANNMTYFYTSVYASLKYLITPKT